MIATQLAGVVTIVLAACVSAPPEDGEGLPPVSGDWVFMLSNCGSPSSGPVSGTMTLLVQTAQTFEGTEASLATATCSSGRGSVTGTINDDTVLIMFRAGQDELVTAQITASYDGTTFEGSGFRPGNGSGFDEFQFSAMRP